MYDSSNKELITLHVQCSHEVTPSTCSPTTGLCTGFQSCPSQSATCNGSVATNCVPDPYGDGFILLETAIITQIEDFIKELGSDFTFVARQKRITVDTVDYYIDLLFFHRELRRLVAIDLKLGKFKPEYEGQMLLYLRYLNQNERKQWEESPIGLILCSEGNTEHVEYLMLDENSPIKVAQYYTQLPDKKLLAAKLKKAIAIAREQSQAHKE